MPEDTPSPVVAAAVKLASAEKKLRSIEARWSDDLRRTDASLAALEALLGGPGAAAVKERHDDELR